MKKILITGADSYIGTSFEKWIGQPHFAGMYEAHTLDMRDRGWKEKDFSGYDVIFHVAGIAHRKETRKNRHLYYEVNRDLAVNIAGKAKREGVRQFILLSSMSVYGMETGVITRETIPSPKSNYGKSKLQAEAGILRMADREFMAAIVRPPMVYGKGCKGNYQLLAKLARKTPVFPYIENQRSMIHIDNLVDFIRRLIEYDKSGIFFPQNQNYVCTSELVRTIAIINQHKILLIKHIGTAAFFCGKIGKKVFGSLVYDIQEDRCKTIPFYESIRSTEA